MFQSFLLVKRIRHLLYQIIPSLNYLDMEKKNYLQLLRGETQLPQLSTRMPKLGMPSPNK